MQALVIAHGELPSAARVKELARSATLLVAADGGADAALALGIPIDAVVGDLDSIAAETVARLDPRIVHRIVNPDTTDLEKAIAFCEGQGATTIDVVGAHGGRPDHALANFSVLLREGPAEVRMQDDHFTVSRVRGEATITGPVGTVVSLIAIGLCEGVITEGLRWPLTNVSLPFSPRGVHNEIARSPAHVSVRSGDLLLFAGRWTEKHQ